MLREMICNGRRIFCSSPMGSQATRFANRGALIYVSGGAWGPQCRCARPRRDRAPTNSVGPRPREHAVQPAYLRRFTHHDNRRAAYNEAEQGLDFLGLHANAAIAIAPPGVRFSEGQRVSRPDLLLDVLMSRARPTRKAADPVSLALGI